MQGAAYFSRVQAVWSNVPRLGGIGTILGFTGPCLVCIIISVVTSLLTVLHLVRELRDPTAIQLRRHGHKSSLKIILTNFASILFVTFYCSVTVIAAMQPPSKRSKTDCILYFLYSNVVPVGLSVFNPIVFVVFTPATFTVAWNGLFRKRTSGSIRSTTRSVPVYK